MPQATAAYENSLGIDAQNPEAHHNLARVLYRLGQVDRSASHLRTAASQCDAIGPWLGLATIVPGCPRASLSEILDVRTSFARRLAEWAAATESGNARPVTKKTRKVLRVGYLSSYFHSVNYMKPVWALVNQHDRAAFEIHLFSNSRAGSVPDGYQRHPSDRFHEVAALDNDELATLFRSLEIDILVDLNGYSEADRLPLFLRHVAPVTIAWFNMYATSGLPGFDYIIGDAEVIGPDEERFFTEAMLRLPLSYLTFEVGHSAPPVIAPPCTANGYMTFGSLVSQYKITPQVLDAWAEVLNRAGSARLVLANAALKSLWNREYVFEQFARRGVDRKRLALIGPAEHFVYLQNYNRIDVALDAFPYNGGTTTMEAIWQGVPVLTFTGDRWASRTSQSLLRNTHLGDFVASDVRGMIDFAVELASNPAARIRLSELRQTMRERLLTSSVCDGRAFARNMERLYQTTWQGPARR